MGRKFYGEIYFWSPFTAGAYGKRRVVMQKEEDNDVALEHQVLGHGLISFMEVRLSWIPWGAGGESMEVVTDDSFKSFSKLSLRSRAHRSKNKLFGRFQIRQLGSWKEAPVWEARPLPDGSSDALLEGMAFSCLLADSCLLRPDYTGFT